MIDIVQTKSEKQIAQARKLLEEYAASLGVDLCFQNFEQELAEFPGAYAPPEGRLLLALYERRPVGCVALRNLGHDFCEMKRLYVRPEHRGFSTGRRLAQAAIDAAKAIGYGAMRLDTLPTMAGAIKLYRSLGFVETEAYAFNPLPGALFMELRLR